MVIDYLKKLTFLDRRPSSRSKRNILPLPKTYGSKNAFAKEILDDPTERELLRRPKTQRADVWGAMSNTLR